MLQLRYLDTLERTVVKKRGEPHANQVSEVLIGYAKTRRTHVPPYWIMEHVHLTSRFDFDWSGEQDSMHG